jgi:hypothetical protein
MRGALPDGVYLDAETIRQKYLKASWAVKGIPRNISIGAGRALNLDTVYGRW